MRDYYLTNLNSCSSAGNEKHQKFSRIRRKKRIACGKKQSCVQKLRRITAHVLLLNRFRYKVCSEMTNQIDSSEKRVHEDSSRTRFIVLWEELDQLFNPHADKNLRKSGAILGSSCCPSGWTSEMSSPYYFFMCDRHIKLLLREIKYWLMDGTPWSYFSTTVDFCVIFDASIEIRKV